MAKYILAIYDPCRDYIERFLRYASRRNCAGGLEICGFTDTGILEAALKEGRIKAVLFSQDPNNTGGNERIRTLLTEGKHDDLTVMVMGEQTALNCEGSGLGFINKYQKAERIFEQIFELTGLNEEKNKTVYRERDLHISGIYAPWDKACHPELAVQLAQIIRKQRRDNGKILYIELEQFSGMNTFLGLPEDTGLSNVIYYYKTRPDQLARALGRAAGSFCGMDILTAPENPEDLEEIEGEEWPDFLESVSRAGDYHNIILDISVMDRFLEETVFKYGSLFIPALPYLKKEDDQTDRYDMAAYKLQEYRNYLKKSGNEKNLERIYEIRPDADR